MSDNDTLNETFPNPQLHRPRHFNKRNLILNQLSSNKTFLNNPSLAELDRAIGNYGKLSEIKQSDDKTVLNKVKFTSVKKEGVGWIRVKLNNYHYKNIRKYLNDQEDKDKMDEVADKKFRKRIKHFRNFTRNDLEDEDENYINSKTQTLTSKIEKKTMSYFPVFFNDELPTEIHKSKHSGFDNNTKNVNNNYLKTELKNYFNEDDNYLKNENNNNYLNTENYDYYTNTETNEVYNKNKKNKSEKKEKNKYDYENDDNQKIKLKPKKLENEVIKSNIIRKVKKKLASKSAKNDKNKFEEEKNDDKEYDDDKKNKIEKISENIIRRKNKKNTETNEIKIYNAKKKNYDNEEQKDNKENNIVHKKNGRKVIGSYKSKRIGNEDKDKY